MKTYLKWSECLPEMIRECFIIECEQNNIDLKRKHESILDVFWVYFWYREIGLGADFWNGVKNLLIDYKEGEAEILNGLDESVPYTKSEVDAMILEYADPNDEVCKVMLANVGKTKEATLANQLTYEALSLSNKNLIIEIGEITKENEALKSTIEALRAIDKAQKIILQENEEAITGLASENSELISETQRLNHLVETQKVEITELENNNHELLEQIKPTPQPKTSLLQRFNNWLS